MCMRVVSDFTCERVGQRCVCVRESRTVKVRKRAQEIDGVTE